MVKLLSRHGRARSYGEDPVTGCDGGGPTLATSLPKDDAA
jgi:hypothetical protein